MKRGKKRVVDWAALSDADFVSSIESIPKFVGPWRVVDMKNGAVTAMERGIPLMGCCHARVQKMRGHWNAYAFGTCIECPADFPGSDGSVDWPSLEDAQAALDAFLKERGVRILDVSVSP